MNRKIKIVAILLIFVSILTIGNALISHGFSINSANLYSKGDAGNLLKYNGALLYSTVVVYQKDGIEYPAYCIQSYLPGVGEKGSYTVNIHNLISNVQVWRAIINGYPYKTPKELGCNSVAEAFTATKQAVYCMLYGNDANNFAGYEAVGEAGGRVLKALKNIVTNAKNSSEVPGTSAINIKQVRDWQIDPINPKFLSITYTLSSYQTEGNYTVDLKGDLPENTYTADVNNNRKTSFASGETVKLLMPIASGVTQKTFKMQVTAKVKIKPVFYGEAPNSSLQDYAVVGGFFEEGSGSKTINTPQNNTKLIINKTDGNTLKPLKGVQFQVENEHNKVIYANLVTDVAGRIELPNFTPGIYYIREINTLEGYTKLEEPLKIEASFGKELTVGVYNYPDKHIEVKIDKETIMIQNQHENINISNSNSNTNISQSDKNTNINSSNQNTNVSKNHQNTNINSSNQNTNVNSNNQNNNINNSNQNTNVNSNNQNKNTNNSNQNTNVNANNQNKNINNSNQNTNVNGNNQNTNINNNNQNISYNNGRVKLPKTGM